MHFYTFYKTHQAAIDPMLINMLSIFLSGFATIWLVIALAQHTYYLLAALLTLLFILHQIQPHSIFLYLFCGIGGVVTESAAISHSAHTWHYAYPTKPFNIPIWLGGVWALASVLIVTMNELIGRFYELKSIVRSVPDNVVRSVPDNVVRSVPDNAMAFDKQIKLNNHLEIIS
jgi:hypothetical protein